MAILKGGLIESLRAVRRSCPDLAASLVYSTPLKLTPPIKFHRMMSHVHETAITGFGTGTNELYDR